MCVIAYLPKECKMPDKKDLLNMWSHNRDGAGLMWIEHGKVQIAKGYMDFETLYHDLRLIKEQRNFECAVHFRWATHGKISEGLCHPFPITNQKKAILAQNVVCDVALMHNGIIPIGNRSCYSDTAEYVVTELYSRYQTDKNFFLNMSEKSERKMLNRVKHSRLLFFSARGIKMVGNWHDYNGYKVSNLNFIPHSYSYSDWSHYDRSYYYLPTTQGEFWA